jgi:endoglucanase
MRIDTLSRFSMCLVPLLLAACGGGGSGSTASSTGSSSGSGSGGSGGSGSSGVVSPHILVDQFGYRPGDPKVAVIRTPSVGYDASDTFAPGSTYQLRQASGGTVVFSGTLSPWNSGAVQASSGDSGWWFDFSSVTTPGSYYVYDVTNQTASPTFSIAQDVYANVLKAAMRMYFYERSGSSDGGGAKQPPYAQACWADTPAYVGPNQDTQAHYALDQTNASLVEDLSGGWFDAGDTNKYVTFAAPAVHQLLSAYQENPSVFTDDFNIPESGNGIPDVLDEVQYETAWIEKMQFSTDGSVALKVGLLGFEGAAPPSSDTSPRFYVGSCSSSTIAAAGVFAHAAYVYGQFSQLASVAADLQTRAISAWNNFQTFTAATLQTDCDTGIVQASDADWTAAMQQEEAVVAAVWLFALTGDATYNTYIENNYTITWPYQDIGWTRYNPEQGKALLFYATLPNADPTLAAAILADKLADVEAGNQIYGFTATDDLYRNYLQDAQYQWGSNQVRADYGNTNADVISYNIGVSSTTPYSTRALETLHYLHGVNPFGMVYLSNMTEYGATSSVNELFSVWFLPGTQWEDAVTSTCGPAPGYLPDGPAADAGQYGIPATLTPPVNQPEQKSYRDWNGIVDNPQNSYVVSEAAIYYQAAYVELLAEFAH